MRKVHIHPALSEGPDPGNGGIGRVIKGQIAALPEFGWEHEPDPAKADLIAGHIEIPPQFLRLFGSKPFVTHNHGAYWHPDYPWGQEWCYATNRKVFDAIRAADVTTAVSEWTAATLRRHSNRDIRVVTHGIDPAEWELPTEGTRSSYVLWNKTRVDPICDPTYVARLAAAMPDVQFITTHLVGDDTFENVIVTDTLPFEEAKTYIQHAGVYLATTRETFGIGTLEALACGVPVVGFDWGGQSEFIEHGSDGWLVPPDDITGLVEGVRWALANADAIAPRARAKAEQYTEQDAARAYAAIYDDLYEHYERRRYAPRTSVIVPVYKMGDFLEATLNSVLKQSDGDWECIIVDDASPDPRDAEIAERFADYDSRFIYHRKPENGYLAAARNTGIELASGRYILPLDADDMISQNALQIFGDALDADRTTDIVYGGAYFVEEDGITPHDYGSSQGPGYSGWPVPFDLGAFFEAKGQPMPYCSMYRREVWELTGGYRERCRTSEDQDFWLRTTSYGFVPRQVSTAPLFIYRLRGESMSVVEGWGDHRPWYPWVNDRSSLPAAAYRDVAAHLIAVPSLDPPVISVVIPVGPGHGRYVLDAIDSVDAQTFRQWECIVVNDSGEALPHLPQWVRVIQPPFYTERDGYTSWTYSSDDVGFGRYDGVAAARNAGIAASKGALFLPLDADDYLQPRALEIMLNVHMDYFETEGERVAVYSDFFEDPDEPGTFTIWETPDFDAHHLHTIGLGYAVTVLTPKAWWWEVGGYDEDLTGWEDWAFALALAGKGHCSTRVPAALFTYRKHTGARAGQNMADFDQAKADIMARDFGADREGHLMACASCRAAAQAGLMSGGGGGMGAVAEASLGSGEGVKVEYVGAAGGKQRIRGTKGPRNEAPTMYPFSDHHRQFWVHPWDADRFAAMEGMFRLVDPNAAAAVRVEAEPVLVADGAPNRVPAQQAAAPALPIPPPIFRDGIADIGPGTASAVPTTTRPVAAAPITAPAPQQAEAVPTPPPPPAPARAIPVAQSATAPTAAAPPPIAQAAATPPVDETPPPATEQQFDLPQGWVSDPEMKRMTRPMVDAYAAQQGLEGAASLQSKEKVIEALAIKREMFS